MKFLHIMSADVGKTYQMIKFLLNNFDGDEHSFLIVATREYVISNNPILLSFPQLIYIEDLKPGKISSWKRFKFYLDLFNRAQYIIWHSYYPMKGKTLPLIASRRAFLDKSVWIEYGFELFRFQNKKRNWKDRRSWILRTQIKSIGATVESDEVAYTEIYGNKSIFPTPLPIAESHIDLLRKRAISEGERDRFPLVLVGYSRFKFSQQMKILQLLKDLDQSRFKMIVPHTFDMLWEQSRFIPSYTLKQLRVFSNKALGCKIPILCKTNVPEETYFKTLAAVDIAIFDGERPLDMDMLLYLLYLNKKVFLPSDSYLAEFLTKQGIKIYDTREIPEMDADSFLEVGAIRNSENVWVQDHLDMNYVKKCWEDLFRALN